MIQKRRFPHISLTASATGTAMLVIVFCIAGATLAARIMHPGISDLANGLPQMRLITAVCFLLAGSSIAFLRGKAGIWPKSLVARIAGSPAGAIGLLTLGSYLFEILTGNELPMARWPVFSFLVNPCRMSIITAGLFSLLGGVLFLLGQPGRRAATAAHVGLLPIVLMTYLVIIGYLFKIHTFYEWLYPGIALNTAIAFIALCIAAFALRPESRLAEVLSGDEAGAVMARRLLPAIVILPLAIGWLRIQGERLGFFSSEVGVALVASAYAICFLAIVWFNARLVNRADRARRALKENLRESEQRLSAVFNGVTESIWLMDIEGNILAANATAARRLGKAVHEIVGKNCFDLIPSDVGESRKRRIAEMVTSDGPVRFEDVREGIVFEHTFYPVRDSRGKIVQIAIFSIDSTARKRAEDALRQSEERFSLALKNAPIAVAVQDRDLRFLWSYDPQSITPEELVGKTDADIFAPEDAAILGALKRKVLASGVEQREQLWVISNGKRLFQDIFLEPIHDAAGIIAGVGVATVDYTQLKNTEEALQRMVKRFELLTDTASELLSAQDPQEIIEHLCRRVMEHLDCHVFFNFLGDDRAGKLHLNAFAGIPEAEAACIEWLDYGVAVCGCAAQEGCRIVAEHIPGTPDPRTDLVRSYGIKAYACHPLKSEGGAAIGTLSFGTRSRETFSNDDLYLMKAVADRVATAMARKRTDQELRKYNRMLKALSKSSQAMTRAKNEAQYLQEVCRIVVEDCGHTLVWVGFAENDEIKTVRPAASAGFEDGYIDNLNITWDDTDRGRGPTGTAIRTGKVGMCRNMATDPAFLPWRAQAAKHGFSASIVLPLMDGPKAFGALTIYSREVDPFSEDEIRLLTELSDDLASGIVTIRSAAARAKAEQELGITAEELSRSNKDLEMFAYAASHDLQEPLRAVAGFMGILKKQYENKLDAEGLEYIEYAVDGAERMQRLIHDLLTYSRVGTRGAAFKPSSAREALDAALYNLRLSIEECGAVVTCDPLPVITADRTQMTQVFQNLIGNALKFRGERTPAIAVSSRHENGSWIFSIEDNGIGIEPQYFDRIFIIFQRLHSREQYDGTGIGLSVVKKIIERHAGRIWVESTYGKGSTFYFSIPNRGAMNEYPEFATDSNTAG